MHRLHIFDPHLGNLFCNYILIGNVIPDFRQWFKEIAHNHEIIHSHDIINIVIEKREDGIMRDGEMEDLCSLHHACERKTQSIHSVSHAWPHFNILTSFHRFHPKNPTHNYMHTCFCLYFLICKSFPIKVSAKGINVKASPHLPFLLRLVDDQQDF